MNPLRLPLRTGCCLFVCTESVTFDYDVISHFLLHLNTYMIIYKVCGVMCPVTSCNALPNPNPFSLEINYV